MGKGTRFQWCDWVIANVVLFSGAVMLYIEAGAGGDPRGLAVSYFSIIARLHEVSR